MTDLEYELTCGSCRASGDDYYLDDNEELISSCPECPYYELVD